MEDRKKYGTVGTVKNYRRADCCKYCYNLDGNEDGSYFCSIFGDPIYFEFVCDEYSDDKRRDNGKDEQL